MSEAKEEKDYYCRDYESAGTEGYTRDHGWIQAHVVVGPMWR